MAEKVRERFIIDVALEEGVELSTRQRNAIAARLSSLAHTIAVADVAPEGVQVLHPEMKVRYAHRHESTRQQSCVWCVQAADDEQNSTTIG